MIDPLAAVHVEPDSATALSLRMRQSGTAEGATQMLVPGNPLCPNDCFPIERAPGRLIACRVDEIRSHSGYARNGITVPASQLSSLAKSGDAIFCEPITIMPGGILLDGYARVHLARQQGRLTLPAVEYDFSESEALQYLLQKHRRSKGLNDFNRILLALELEPWLREQARSNQKVGGQRKGSSNLTEADRLDVRFRIAAAAGVSTGNLSKARRLISDAHPQVLEALRISEVSIHRASTWLRTPNQQLKELKLHQDHRGITRTIHTLLKAHSRPRGTMELDLQRITSALAAMTPEQREAVFVVEFNVQGAVLLLSTSLLRTLNGQGEFFT